MAKNLEGQRFFIIEGNIGAGKSTFLKILKQYLNVQTVPEPHEKWQHVGDGHNLLDFFYKDPKRWAYTFQSYAFVSRVMKQKSYAQKNPYAIQILERSVFSDRYCFALNAHQLGYMNALEWQLYCEWFSWLVKVYAAKPDGFIYLRTDPQVCYQRIQKRNRHEEDEVSLDYIKRIHEKHEDWLIEKRLGEREFQVPVLILDCDADFETSKIEQEKHIEKVGAFILSHIPTSPSQPPLSSLS